MARYRTSFTTDVFVILFGNSFKVFRRTLGLEVVDDCFNFAVRYKRRMQARDATTTSHIKHITLAQKLLGTLPRLDVRQLTVPAKKDAPERIATLELRFSELRMPVPKVLTPWLKDHRPLKNLTLWVVELLEINPPQGIQGLHWVLYTMEPVTTIAHADTVIGWYKRRPTIEDYHKAFKTGCHVQERYYETSERLERVTALLSVVAVRLMQLKTAAVETPDRPARELAPIQWVRLVQTARRKPVNESMTIREFIRALGGLGGHLGRKSDGEPGWITVWRGFEKLMLLARGADLLRKKCG